MSPSVLCIGHASYDLCMVVSEYPAENSKTETDLLVESGGGPAANAAWLLARWGVATGFAGIAGDDYYGQRVVDELREVGVDCRLLRQLPGHATPVSFIISNRSSGSRTIINRKSSAAMLHLQPEMLAEFRPSLLLLDGHELEASLQVMEAFPEAITVLDAGSLRAGTQHLAERVRYLVSSERFAVQVTGEKDIVGHWQAVLAKLRCFNADVVVVTLGEQGLIYDAGGQQGQLPALAVQAKDTTAAGDIFHGAFAFALLQDLKLQRALRFATVAAGLSVQGFGGRPSAPELEVVEEMMKDA